VSIEESVKSIVSSLGAGIDKAKAWAEFLWHEIKKFKNTVLAYFNELPDWVKKVLTGGAIALGISWLTGGLGLGGLTTGLIKALTAVGLSLGPAGWALAIAATVLATLIIKNKEELAKWFDPTKELQESYAGQAGIVGLQKLVEWSPINWLTGGQWSNWWDENVVYPLTKSMLDSEKEISESVQLGVHDPTVREFKKLSDDLVGFSVIPEMVEEVVRWFEQITLDLTPWLDQLTGKFDVLSKAIKGIPPVPKDLIKFDSGQIKITTIDLSGSTFGGDLTERKVKDWMFEAIEDVV